MKANPLYLQQSKEFWANVRVISQEIGYTVRGQGTILIPTVPQIRYAFNRLSLSIEHIADTEDSLTKFGDVLLSYFAHRAHVLYDDVQNNLMEGIS